MIFWYAEQIYSVKKFFTSKKHRSYAIYESFYPEAFKIMEEIYLDKLDDPASLKISATKIKCSKRGKLYEQDMPRSL